MGETLPNIAMFVEEFYGGRELLNEVLHRVFSTKNAPTIIHKLIVMQRPRLIITTNYDNLIEEACRQEHVEHCVIATDLHGGYKGGMYLYRDGSSNKWRRHDRFPVENLNDNAVLIYKAHGTIDVDDKDIGYFLVSDEDYYYAAINTYLETIFPLMIKCELSEKRTLFLGYSMSDIHVRHIYRQIRFVHENIENKNIAICYLPDEKTTLRYRRLSTNVYDMKADDFADLIIDAMVGL
jgi:hypothetical protein